jgi:membrane protein
MSTASAREGPGRPRPARLPLWVPALTGALLALGFRRERYATPSRRQGLGRPSHQKYGRGHEQGPPYEQGLRYEPGLRYESGHGRLAATPSEIPAPGWKDILLRVWNNIGEDRVILVAAGVTFYSLLAIFPAIAALVAIYGLFADPSKIAAHVDSLSGVLPGGALETIRNQMNLVASQGSSKLGVTFLIGFAVSLWSANAGIKSIFDALNLVYNEPEKRGLVGLNLVSLAFTIAAIVFVLLAIGCIAALPAISTNQLQGPTALIVQIGRWPVLFVVVAFGLALVYRFGPSRRKPQWRWVSWGTALASVAWIVVSILFSWYAQNFGSYNKTYGSLAAVIVFMVWIWLSTAVILIGAELDAEMEHQTVRDTTTCGRKPLGTRGATMADTVGPAQD